MSESAVTVCCHFAPPVPPVIPQYTVVCDPRKSAIFTVMRCVKRVPSGASVDANIAHAHASYEILTRSGAVVVSAPRMFWGSTLTCAGRHAAFGGADHEKFARPPAKLLP